MHKKLISWFLRHTRLLRPADYIRFHIEKLKNKKRNSDFIKKNPEIKLPPDYLIYESFRLDYEKYYTDGQKTAEWLTGHFKRHINTENVKIFDWGCGPGRVIRHLHSFTGSDCKFYGTDYNAKSIAWCSENLPDIEFNRNSNEAELPYENNFFDIIYGISVFTHLSEKMHTLWFNELLRVLKPGGIMLFTTQGKNFRNKLTRTELKKFNSGKPVVRGKTKEGHRTFSAFQPSDFMKDLFESAQILEHIEREPESDKWRPQDIWIVRK